MIPRIIHQIWSGIRDPLPNAFQIFSETWKKKHPTWKYEFWDNARMNRFILDFYPQYWDIYNRFPYDVQRWDAIRYLILDRMGGMYVDFDYECIDAMDQLLSEKTCCFAMEPQSHCEAFSKSLIFNNALMASIPGHPFMKEIIQYVFTEKALQEGKNPKNICVFKTTGPWMLVHLYEQLTLSEQKEIFLMEAKYVTPFDYMQVRQIERGVENEDVLENCLTEAYAVHYFCSGWLKDVH